MSPTDTPPRDFRARVGLNGRAAPAPGPVRVDTTGLDGGSGPAGPLRVDYDEVELLERSELAVGLRLFDGTQVTFDRGGSLDDLWNALRARFLARVSDSLRFAPADPRHTFDARLTLEAGGAISSPAAGNAGGFADLPVQVSVVRLGLNYLSETGPGAQLPFGALGEASFDPGRYEVTIPVEPGPAAPGGARLVISKLARRTEEFQEIYRQARSASLADTARCLAALAPEVPAGQRMALADELRVGRMVTRDRFEALAPGGWPASWDAAAGAGRAPYRDALEKLAGDGARLLLGLRPYGGVIRTGENAADDGDVPAGDAPAGPSVPEPPAAGPASAGDSDEVADSGFPVVYAAALLTGASAADDRLALEVLSETDHATYIYRVSPSPAGLDRQQAGEWLAAVASHTLLALNFRKEPLYLPEPELLRSREGLYRAALRRLPGLRDLRARLVGRARHSSPAAWAAQLEKPS